MATLSLYALILSGLTIPNEINPQWIKIIAVESSYVFQSDSFFWNRTAEIILSPFIDSGYAFASLSVNNSTLKADTLILETKLDSGQLVTVSNLGFKGSFYTKPRYLSYLAGFSNFRFSRPEVELLRKALHDEGCEVIDWELLGDDSLATLNFHVREQRIMSRLNTGLGYSSKEGLTGIADVYVSNVLGWREVFSLSGRRLSRYGLFFSFLSRVPNPLLLPFGVEASASFRSFDTTSFHLEAGGGVFIKRKNFETLLGYAYELDRSDSLEISKNLATTRIKTWIINLDIKGGQRRSIKNSTYLKSVGSLNISISLPWRFSISVNPNAGLVYSTDTLINTELIPLGGARSLRGYQEEEFRATGLVWSRQELRWGTEAFSIYPLFDAAWIPSYALFASYGVGVAVGTPIGRLELDAALPWAAPWQEAKVHLSLTSEF